ncbi:hypothetical protein BC834DRAFT_899389 [Gloeopeniophorella convolvens]|nr:hypothetical protein BC834DRAFT_899389 [Gloeopeniophorella convolvens]
MLWSLQCSGHDPDKSFRGRNGLPALRSRNAGWSRERYSVPVLSRTFNARPSRHTTSRSSKPARPPRVVLAHSLVFVHHLCISEMSGQAASPPASALPPSLVGEWSALVGPAINFLMIGASMGAVLVVMLLALLFFSDSAMWRKPVFILNVLSIMLGIAASIVNIYIEVHSLRNLTPPSSPALIVVEGSLFSAAPIVVDSVLLFRLLAIFPRKLTSLRVYITVLAFPVLLKFGRIANNAVYLNYDDHFARSSLHSTTPDKNASILKAHQANVKAEWILQLVDNMYCSGIFLYKIYRHDTLWKSGSSIARRIRTLFWISATNFVFPVILGIAELAVYFASSNNYLLALYIDFVKMPVNVIGVVFATLWAAEGRRRAESSQGTMVQPLSAMRFPYYTPSHTTFSDIAMSALEKPGEIVFSGASAGPSVHSSHANVTEAVV